MTTSARRRSRTPGAPPSWRRLVLLLVGVLVLVLPATMALASNGQGEENRSEKAAQADRDNSHCDEEDSGPGHSDCKPDNNPQPENPPCDADHGHPGDNAKPCQEGSDNPGSCSDGEDNDGDGLIDEDDPDCQEEPCDDADEDGICDEDDTEGPAGDPSCSDGVDNDGDGDTDAEDSDCDGGPTAENLCTADANDPGLPLTEHTLGQTLYDGGLNVSPLFEDPERNGPLSGAVGDAGTDTPLEPVTDEVACAVDLLIDESVGGDL